VIFNGEMGEDGNAIDEIKVTGREGSGGLI
jgi:hypothetical protein